MIDEVACGRRDHRIAAAQRPDRSPGIDRHVGRSCTRQDRAGGAGVLQQAVYLHRAVQQGQSPACAKGKARVADDSRAGAVDPADRQILDPRQLGEAVGGDDAVQTIEVDVGRSDPWFEHDAGGRDIGQRRIGEADVVGAQRQRIGAGVKIDRAAEVDIAIGVDRRPAQQRQRRGEVDVVRQFEQTAEPLYPGRLAEVDAAQPGGDIGRVDLVAEDQPARSQLDMSTDRRDVLRAAGVAEIDVQIASVGRNVLGEVDRAATANV